MKRFFLGFGLSLIAAVAFAATAHYTWQNATTNTDGTAIPTTGDGRIITTNVEYGPCNAAKDGLASVTGNVAVAGNVEFADVANLGPGTWCAHAAHVNSYNTPSDWSNIAVKVVPAPKPNPPKNFTIG